MTLDPKAISEVLGDNILFVVFVVVILWLLITKLAETQEAFAKLLGPIGRRITRNKERRDEERREEVRNDAKKLLQEAGTLEPPDYQTVKGRLANVLEEVGAQALEIREMQLENRGLRTYILQDEDWHWEDARQALREDRTIRDRVGFDDYMADFMRRNQPVTRN